LLVVLAVGSAVVAAITSTRNAALSIFAGVIVGSVVTAAGTWVVGPALERRVRRESEREDAIMQMIVTLERLRSDAGELSVLVFARNRRLKRALKRIADRSIELRVLALRTRSQAIVLQLERFVHDVTAAFLASSDLPDEEPDEHGMVPLTFRVGGKLIRASAAEDDRTSEIDDLVCAVHPSFVRLLDVLLQEGAYPSRQIAEKIRSPRFTTRAERDLADSIGKKILTELAHHEDICKSVGIELFALMAGGDTGEEMSLEIEKLETSDESLGNDPSPAQLGRRALLMLAEGGTHTQDYPAMCAATAQMFMDGFEPSL
jgi:hypothetical protein